MIGLAILVVIAGYFMMQEKPAPQAPKETPKQEAPAPKPAETPKPAEAPKAEEKPAETPKPAEAPKAEEKPAEEPKPEEKPAEAPKAEEKPAEPAKTEEPKAAVEPVKVGYLAALTGDWAAYGQTEEKTARLAVKEINDKGGVLGRPLELVVYDFRTRAEDAVNAVRRMIEEDKVVAIVGANGSGINIATAPIVNRLGVSQVGTVSTNPLVTVDEKGAVRPYSFRICFTDPYQGKLIAFFAASELKKMNAAILYDVGNDYSQGLREFFMKSYGEYGGKVVADLGFRGGQDVDFRAQLTEIREKGADVLVLPNMGKEMALIMKQARELGLKDIVFVGGDGYGEFMWEIAGDAMEGSYWINHVAPEDPAMQPFFTSYREMWNDECKEFVNGVLGYDSVYWVADAISRAGSDDPKAIRDALEATKDLKLHHATITMDPATHNPVDKDGVVLIAKDGKGQFFTKIKP
jgi:branched-chain amino acid transport system substrate-binding protein